MRQSVRVSKINTHGRIATAFVIHLSDRAVIR
jgi:hypothetical protein